MTATTTSKKLVTTIQRARIAGLRDRASRMSGVPAAIAAEKCQPYEDDADTYIRRLETAIREWMVGVKPTVLPAGQGQSR
jgi:hypothetical protein